MIVTIILEVAGFSYVCRTFENESIQIDRVVAAVDDLGTQGTVTKQGFRLPLVGDLLEALGDITDPSQEAKVDLNKAIKGKILIGGFERFAGSFFVTNAVAGNNTKEVELLFQGSETNLKAVLSNITMAELFAGETVLYNYTEIKQYFDAPNTYRDANGYVFPVVDYGQDYQNSLSLKEDAFKPAVTFKKCFDLMPIVITTTGLERLMNQVILLHNDKNTTPSLNTSPLDNTGVMAKTSSQSFTTFSPVTATFQTEENYRFDNFDLANDKYVIPTTGEYTFRIEGSVRFSSDLPTEDGTASPNFTLKDLTSSLIVQVINGAVFIPQGTSVDVAFVKNITIQCTAGQEFTLQLASDSDDGTSILEGFQFGVVAAPSLNSASQIDISSNCPELTAWEIFSTIVLQCNGQIITNQDGSYTLAPWVSWVEDSSEVIILDDIIEEKIDVQIKPFSIDGAKSVRLGYKENDDIYSNQYLEVTNEPYGQKLIRNTGTEFAKNEIEVEIPISVIPSVGVGGSGAVIPKMYDKELNTIKGNPTLLQTGAGVMTIQLILGSNFSTDTTTYNTIPFIGNWSLRDGGFNEFDNNFGQSLSYWTNTGYPNNTLYELYWKKYIQETYSRASREVKINIKLSVNDIDGWQFNEKFYYKNTLFRLISLSGISLTSNDSYVSATFMKRFTIFNVDIAPFYPYNVLNSIVQWKDSLTNAALSPADGSSADQTDLQNSAIAYGFFYDSVKEVATQNGQILIT